MTQPPLCLRACSISAGTIEPARFRQRNSNALFWWNRNFSLRVGIKAHTLSSSSGKGVLEEVGMEKSSNPPPSSSSFFFSESSSLRAPLFVVQPGDANYKTKKNKHSEDDY